MFQSTIAPAKLPDRMRGGVAALVRQRLGLGTDDMLEPSIYRFVLRYSLPEQVYLVVVTLLSFPFLYLSLDLPKQIINEAIGGKHFPREFFGFELGQIAYLVLLCLVFLAFVVINGWFKYHLHLRRGRVGERMLRRLGYRPVPAPVALSDATYRPHRDRPDHRDADGGAGAGRRFYRRRLRAADRARGHDPWGRAGSTFPQISQAER